MLGVFACHTHSTNVDLGSLIDYQTDNHIDCLTD